VLGGTGQQGGGLAGRFAGAGLRVIIGSRDPGRARDAAAGPPASGGQPLEITGYAAAVSRAEVTVLAVPFGSVDSLLRELRPAFKAGALVIDVTVPVTFTGGKLAMIDVAEGSAAEHVRARLPPEVRVAGAFKTVPAHLLGGSEPLDCDEFVCGDSDEARQDASTLVRLVPGLRPIDVGPLSRARSIEHLTALAIAINRRHKIHDARFRVIGLR
jgi:NADPH-dependent F420 reductase